MLTEPKIHKITDYPACCRRLLGTHTEGDFGGYRYFLHSIHAGMSRKRTVTYPHSHLGYEFFAVLEGAMVFQAAAGSEMVVDAGAILIVPAQLRHATYRTDEHCLSVTLRFFTDPPLQPSLPLHVLNDFVVFNELLALLSEAEFMRSGWQERVCHRMPVLLSLLISAFIPVEFSGDELVRPVGLSQQVDAYLRKHLMNPITLSDVANALGISVRSLIRQFKEESGNTVMNRLHSLRIEAALTLLAERPDMPIKQVSAMVGIPDHAYFSNFFRRIMGLSPQRYRRHSLVTLSQADPQAEPKLEKPPHT